MGSQRSTSRFPAYVVAPVQPRHLHQFWHFSLEVALMLPAQLLRPLTCSTSTLARSQHGCLCFVHVRFPVAVSCLTTPGRLAEPLCFAGVPSKAMEIWLLTLTRAGLGPAGPAGCEIFGPGAVSLCKQICTGTVWI